MNVISEPPQTINETNIRDTTNETNLQETTNETVIHIPIKNVLFVNSAVLCLNAYTNSETYENYNF